MGGTADAPVNRQGSGDNFVITALGDVEFLEQPLCVYEGMGVYTCTYSAILRDNTAEFWPMSLRITLAEQISGLQQDIEGSPFTLSMAPDYTSATFSYASGDALANAAAGDVAGFSIQGKDCYNNKVFECVDGYAATLSLVDEEFYATATQLSCYGGLYVMEYYTEIAGDYLLDVVFNGDAIEGAPFTVTAISSSVSAANSFMATTEAFNSSTVALATNGMPSLVAGESRRIVFHLFDRFGNRMTQQQCNPISDCTHMDYQWCRRQPNVSLVTPQIYASCQAQMVCSSWPGFLGTCESSFSSSQTGTYSTDITLSRAGSYVVSAWADGAAVASDFSNSGIIISVIPSDASPQATVATPSDIAVAGEIISFTIRAFDRFNNFVGEPGLVFVIRYTFPLGEPLDEETLLPTTQEDPTVSYESRDGTYKCTYIVETGGFTMPIILTITLGGVDIGQSFEVLARAAQNKPALCYVITKEVGPPEMRMLDLSQDLLNPYNKAAGDVMGITVQSITKTGDPRAYLSELCSQEQIDSMDTMACDQLDEFNVVLELKSDSRVRFSGTTTITCDETSDTSDPPDPEWIPNNCGRTGQYKLSYYATVSGIYELQVTSLGLLIQTSSESIPPHDFTEYMPYEVSIYPAAMAAGTSRAEVDQLSYTSTADVVVSGFDTYGNRLAQDGGEHIGLKVVLQTSCDTPSVEFSFHYDDTAPEPGTFRSSISPNFGGPVTVTILYNPTLDFTDVEYQDYIVGGVAHHRIAKLGVANALPNTGMIDGGTITNIPLLGACDWTGGWVPEVQCSWDGVDVASTITDDWTFPRQIQVKVSGMQAAGSSWYVRSTRSSTRLAEHTVLDSDLANTTAVQLVWALPAGQYVAHFENPSKGTMHVEISDEIGNLLRSIDMSGVSLLDTETFVYEASRLVNCGPSPSLFDITGSEASVAFVAAAGVSIQYSGTTDTLFSELDSSAVYESKNTRPYYYYPPPVLTRISSVVGGISAGNDTWSHTYAPTTGGMPLTLHGSGFDNGIGAVKDYYLCVFADFDCKRARGADSHDWEYGDHGCHVYEPILNNERRLTYHPPTLWITPATFVSDAEVTCLTPVVSVTGKARVLLTMNSQELPNADYFIEFFQLVNVTNPEVSPIGGGMDVNITLLSGPPTMGAWCKVWFEGQVGDEGTEPTPGLRLDNQTILCTTPNSINIPVQKMPRNVYVPMSISFDGNIYSTPSYFLYFAQPDISRIYPPVGPTGGGTPISIELLAGPRYDRPMDQPPFVAVDFRPLMDPRLSQPRCLFKRSASTQKKNRGLSIESHAEWAIEERMDNSDPPQPYLSQQIRCETPSNPNPGSYYFLEVSLDYGATYCYENGGKQQDPPKFRYFADTMIKTEDPERNYNSAVTFRTKASDKLDWDASVDVWFEYSCGYSHQYASFARCKYVDTENRVIIAHAQPETLRIGADSVNAIVCDVPQQTMPNSASIQLALNGVDYTPVGPGTFFVWFGDAIAVNGAYVQNAADTNRQFHFTVKASALTFIDMILVEIVDSAENYVSEDAVYQSATSYISFELVRTGQNNTVIAHRSQNLTAGITFYDSISITKPSQGNYEVMLAVDGLVTGMVPLTIVTGAINMSNVVVTYNPLPPQVDISPGLPFLFTIRGRDSADNYRAEGGNVFRFRVEMRECTSGGGPPNCTTANFRSEAVLCNGNNKEECNAEKYFDDIGDGTYFMDPYVDTQYYYENGEQRVVNLEGRYAIIIEGQILDESQPSGFGWTPILSSPLAATMVRIDCTMGGVLPGAAANREENMCQCTAGWELAADQSLVEDAPVNVFCSICPLGRYKLLGGADVTEESVCMECPPTTHTIVEGANMLEQCICMPDFYDWRTWEIDCIEVNFRNLAFTDGAVDTFDMCTPCPPCVTCFGNTTIAVHRNWWAMSLESRAPSMSGSEAMMGYRAHMVAPESTPMLVYRCNQGGDGVCLGGIHVGMEGTDACKIGSDAVVCAACGVGYMGGDEGCEACPEEEEGFSVRFDQLLVVIIGAGLVFYLLNKALDKATAQDLLVGKILLAFAQVVQSFAATYSVSWPPRLLAFIEKMKVVNFDIFTMGNTECTFPGAKNFYTKFIGTCMIPVALSTLVLLKFLHHKRRLKMQRSKFMVRVSLLEEKIEKIEISGAYVSKFFFVLIVTYLKTSAVVLEIFKCRYFEPSPEWDYQQAIDDGNPHDSDRGYLEADLRLSCEDLRYKFMLTLGLAAVFTVRALPGRLRALSVFLSKSVLYGTVAWASRALNSRKRRFPALAVSYWRPGLLLLPHVP
jgi:hypothetical protein